MPDATTPRASAMLSCKGLLALQVTQPSAQPCHALESICAQGPMWKIPEHKYYYHKDCSPPGAEPESTSRPNEGRGEGTNARGRKCVDVISASMQSRSYSAAVAILHQAVLPLDPIQSSSTSPSHISTCR